ncbi:MAG: LptF/LptG family permease [Chloroherpetonaceae bacterium]|nr:LptF/LptG family permease [Chloroherpetonaceae bacterium]
MFNRIDRYIIKEYLFTLLFALLAFICLFILIDLIEKIDDYIDRKAKLEAIALYYLYLSPEILKLVAPVAGLLSALFVTGKMAKQTELLAIQAGGVSLYRILLPFLFVGFLLTTFDLFFSGWLVPITTRYKQKFETLQLGRSYWTGGSRSNLNIQDSPSRFVSISYYDDPQQTCYTTSIFYYTNFELVKRLDMPSLKYDSSTAKWIGKDIVERRFIRNEEIGFVKIKIDTIELSFSIRDLRENNSALELLNLVDHKRFIEARKRSGFESTSEAEVKYHSKISFPFACLIVILLGVPLSAQKKKTGIALEAGISGAIGFFYIGLQQTFATLGYKGAITPIIAAWAPNFLFLFAGIIMVIKAKK